MGRTDHLDDLLQKTGQDILLSNSSVSICPDLTRCPALGKYPFQKALASKLQSQSSLWCPSSSPRSPIAGGDLGSCRALQSLGPAGAPSPPVGHPSLFPILLPAVLCPQCRAARASPMWITQGSLSASFLSADRTAVGRRWSCVGTQIQLDLKKKHQSGSGLSGLFHSL